jgi:hypothetical protein
MASIEATAKEDRIEVMRTRSAGSNYLYMPPEKYVKGRDEWPLFERDSRILPRVFSWRGNKNVEAITDAS